ncbi:MAG: DUF177 domain-containing protein [Gammaproteobacteria bacterium]|nr:DUF177 domain-containing protein [Gammaproteobacteria bacterium]
MYLWDKLRTVKPSRPLAIATNLTEEADFTQVFFDRKRSKAYYGRLMLAGQLPDRIDPLRFAEARRRLQGGMDIAKMERLQSYLASDTGQVQVELDFGIAEDGLRYIHGHLSTKLSLVCQRCLNAMEQLIEAEVRLGVISDQSLADTLPETYEPLVLGQHDIFLRDLIEDELILALPLVPKHPNEQCKESLDSKSSGHSIKFKDDVIETETNEEESVVRKENPFAVLSSFKSDLK